MRTYVPLLTRTLEPPPTTPGRNHVVLLDDATPLPVVSQGVLQQTPLLELLQRLCPWRRSSGNASQQAADCQRPVERGGWLHGHVNQCAVPIPTESSAPYRAAGHAQPSQPGLPPYERGDSRGGVRGILVLPHPHDEPTRLPEACIGVGVAIRFLWIFFDQ